MLKSGRIVSDYVVDAEVGAGGIATVYRVIDRRNQAVRALKVLHVQTPTIRERLEFEGQIQSALRHPNIVPVYDVLNVDGWPALVMEYIDGPSLQKWLATHRVKVSTAERLFRGIVDAVALAHEHGLVHRDLKPANILLQTEKGQLVPKVTDFGLARLVLEDQDFALRSRSGIAIGTPGYMALEQLTDPSRVDQRADIFALGCILYELLTGKRAYDGPDVLAIFNRVALGRYIPPQHLTDGLPPHLINAVIGCLHPIRDERIGDCTRLRSVLDGTPLSSSTIPADPADLDAPRILRVENAAPPTRVVERVYLTPDESLGADAWVLGDARPAPGLAAEPADEATSDEATADANFAPTPDADFAPTPHADLAPTSDADLVVGDDGSTAETADLAEVGHPAVESAEVEPAGAPEAAAARDAEAPEHAAAPEAPVEQIAPAPEALVEHAVAARGAPVEQDSPTLAAKAEATSEVDTAAPFEPAVEAPDNHVGPAAVAAAATAGAAAFAATPPVETHPEITAEEPLAALPGDEEDVADLGSDAPAGATVRVFTPRQRTGPREAPSDALPASAPIAPPAPVVSADGRPILLAAHRRAPSATSAAVALNATPPFSAPIPPVSAPGSTASGLPLPAGAALGSAVPAPRANPAVDPRDARAAIGRLRGQMNGRASTSSYVPFLGVAVVTVLAATGVLFYWDKHRDDAPVVLTTAAAPPDGQRTSVPPPSTPASSAAPVGAAAGNSSALAAGGTPMAEPVAAPLVTGTDAPQVAAPTVLPRPVVEPVRPEVRAPVLPPDVAPVPKPEAPTVATVAPAPESATTASVRLSSDALENFLVPTDPAVSIARQGKGDHALTAKPGAYTVVARFAEGESPYFIDLVLSGGASCEVTCKEATRSCTTAGKCGTR